MVPSPPDSPRLQIRVNLTTQKVGESRVNVHHRELGLVDHYGAVTALTDHQGYLYTGSVDGCVKKWSPDGIHMTTFLGIGEPIEDFDIDHNLNILIVIYDQGSVSIHDLHCERDRIEGLTDVDYRMKLKLLNLRTVVNSGIFTNSGLTSKQLQKNGGEPLSDTIADHNILDEEHVTNITTSPKVRKAVKGGDLPEPSNMPLDIDASRHILQFEQFITHTKTGKFFNKIYLINDIFWLVNYHEVAIIAKRTFLECLEKKEEIAPAVVYTNHDSTISASTTSGSTILLLSRKGSVSLIDTETKDLHTVQEFSIMNSRIIAADDTNFCVGANSGQMFFASINSIRTGLAIEERRSICTLPDSPITCLLLTGNWIVASVAYQNNVADTYIVYYDLNCGTTPKMFRYNYSIHRMYYSKQLNAVIYGGLNGDVIIQNTIISQSSHSHSSLLDEKTLEYWYIPIDRELNSKKDAFPVPLFPAFERDFGKQVIYGRFYKEVRWCRHQTEFVINPHDVPSYQSTWGRNSILLSIVIDLCSRIIRAQPSANDAGLLARIMKIPIAALCIPNNSNITLCYDGDVIDAPLAIFPYMVNRDCALSMFLAPRLVPNMILTQPSIIPRLLLNSLTVELERDMARDGVIRSPALDQNILLVNPTILVSELRHEVKLQNPRRAESEILILKASSILDDAGRLMDFMSPGDMRNRSLKLHYEIR